ncbi:hypothetical protein CDAR_622271 [Caerostris darwini]|uniref:Uncharacterized protein n=1 Tax=Caerostris darwini TaxID=1538125 RepID=A0AAV4QDB5_9ARAC|nr:hypothetical protein CDAR_622271 [Caerostris darwini]
MWSREKYTPPQRRSVVTLRTMHSRSTEVSRGGKNRMEFTPSITSGPFPFGHPQSPGRPSHTITDVPELDPEGGTNDHQRLFIVEVGALLHVHGRLGERDIV